MKKMQLYKHFFFCYDLWEMSIFPKIVKEDKKTMVLTWIGDVRPLLQESCYLRYWRQLPAFRREKADRYRFPMGRALSVGVWILWQQAQADYGLPQDAPFNLSHSGHYALCSAETGTEELSGAGRIRVGCDVEQIHAYQEGIARRFFSPEEYRHIQSQEDLTVQTELFYRYWVLKESFIKATRQGMAMALDSFSFDIKYEKDPVLTSCPAPYRKEEHHFREFTLASYRAAVCSTDPVIDPALHWVVF